MLIYIVTIIQNITYHKVISVLSIYYACIYKKLQSTKIHKMRKNIAKYSEYKIQKINKYNNINIDYKKNTQNVVICLAIFKTEFLDIILLACSF